MFYINEIQQAALDAGHLWINNNWFIIFLLTEAVIMLGFVASYLWYWVDDNKINGEDFFWYIVGSAICTATVGLGSYAAAHVLLTLYVHLPWYALLGIVTFIILMFVARYARRTHKLLHKHTKDKAAHK